MKKVFDFDSAYASLFEKIKIARQEWEDKEAVALPYIIEAEKAADQYEALRKAADMLMDKEAKNLAKIMRRGYSLALIKLISQDGKFQKRMDSRLSVISHYDSNFVPCFVVVDRAMLMESQKGFGQYYTTEQVRAVAKLFKDAINRGDKEFKFPASYEA